MTVGEYFDEIHDRAHKLGLETGMAEGMAQGMAEGMAQGKIQGAILGARDILRSLHFSEEDILKKLREEYDMDEAELQRILAE